MKLKRGDEIMVHAGEFSPYLPIQGMTGIILEILPDKKSNEILYQIQTKDGRVFINITENVLILYNPSKRVCK